MKQERTPYEELFEIIGRLARRRYQLGLRAFSKLGLNHTEARVVTLLTAMGGQAGQDDISSEMNVDRSNCGRAMKLLEDKRLLERVKSTEDARTNIVRLTDSGRFMASELQDVRCSLATTFFEGLSEADADKIASMLRESAARVDR